MGNYLELFRIASETYASKTMRGFEALRATIRSPPYAPEEVAYFNCLYDSLVERNGVAETRLQARPFPDELHEDALARLSGRNGQKALA